MSHREAWVFLGNHGVSSAPFADNLPGLRQVPGDRSPDRGADIAWLAPDEPMLPALQVCLASLGIVAVTVAALLAAG